MLVRLRAFLARPAAYGALALSYIGIIGAVAYAASVGAQSATALDQEARDSRAAIVASGQVAIKSACVFDNKRARELRQILRDSKGQTAAYVKEGLLTQEQANRSVRETNPAIKQITLRVCEKEARVLPADPVDAPYNRLQKEKNDQ